MQQRLDINYADRDGQYKNFLESIKRSMDPNSNTVLLVDDEKGIRMKVARDVGAFDPSIVIIRPVMGAKRWVS